MNGLFLSYTFLYLSSGYDLYFMEKTLIVLVGPTGIGKTKASIQLAQYFNTEIISSDSRQIFKELRIGTAVPAKHELELVKHHFIQTHSVQSNYNASKFEFDVLKLLSQLFVEKDIVIMAGGSMLYIDAVCKGIDDIPTVDAETRDLLMLRLEEEGIESMRLQLKQLDPDYYSRVDLKNPKRILHALEICLMTGKPYSSFLRKTTKKRPFKIIKTGLTCDRDILYKRINMRVDKMIADGLIEEARSIYRYKNLNALNTVGYKELFAYFEGAVDKGTAIEQIKKNTRNYARKQIRWFKKYKEIKWFDFEDTEGLINYFR